MKPCPKCHEESEDHFDSCWSCGTDFPEGSTDALSSKTIKLNHPSEPNNSQDLKSSHPQQPPLENMSLTSVLVVCAVAFSFWLFGNYHVVTGNLYVSGINGFDLIARDSFGYSEIYIDADAISRMPMIAAIVSYPVGYRVLVREKNKNVSRSGRSNSADGQIPSPAVEPVAIPSPKFNLANSFTIPAHTPHPHYQLDKPTSRKKIVIQGKLGIGPLLGATAYLETRELGDIWIGLPVDLPAQVEKLASNEAQVEMEGTVITWCNEGENKLNPDGSTSTFVACLWFDPSLPVVVRYSN